MRIARRKLLLIIENYLNESIGDPPGSTISKINTDIKKTLDKIEKSDLGNEYSEEYNEKAKMVIDKIDFIYNEAVKKFDNKSKKNPEKYKPLTEKQKKTLKQYLENIRVVLVKRIPPDSSIVAAAAGLAWIVGLDEEGNREVQGAPGSIKMDDIKDDMVLGGKKFLEDHRKNPNQNPLILITSNKHRSFFLNVTAKDIADVIVHELDHIKYGLLYLYDKKFNVKEIEKVLRRDLAGKSEDEIVAILSKEGFFPNEAPVAKKRRIFVMNQHYQKIFGNKKLITTADYEEFAVRINILTRISDQNKIKIAEQLNSNKLSVSDAKSKYGQNISQVIPFLKKPIQINDLEEIVKKQNKEEKFKKN